MNAELSDVATYPTCVLRSHKFSRSSESRNAAMNAPSVINSQALSCVSSLSAKEMQYLKSSTRKLGHRSISTLRTPEDQLRSTFSRKGISMKSTAPSEWHINRLMLRNCFNVCSTGNTAVMKPLAFRLTKQKRTAAYFRLPNVELAEILKWCERCHCIGGH